jgi:hypothetical protein
MKTVQNLIILLGHAVLFIPKKQFFLTSDPLKIPDRYLNNPKFDELEKKIDTQTTLPIKHKENNFLKNNLTLLIIVSSIVYLYFNFHKLSFRKKIILITICSALFISWAFGPISFLSAILSWIVKGCFYILKPFFSSILFFGY